jgi:hypothetical protein
MALSLIVELAERKLPPGDLRACARARTDHAEVALDRILDMLIDDAENREFSFRA